MRRFGTIEALIFGVIGFAKLCLAASGATARTVADCSKRSARIITLISSLGFLSSLAEARVTRIDITSRIVVADGMPFGDTGPYEKLRGTVYFEVDPDDPQNAVVFYLDKAPRTARGMVEFSADMMIIKPIDFTKGNRELLFEVNNHGNVISLSIMNNVPRDANQNNPTAARDFGNGFLQRQGYTLAWVGSRADVVPGNNRLTAQFPIATEGGQPIGERILVEFRDGRGAAVEEVFTLPLSGSATFKPYEAVSTDQDVAMAELRLRPSDSSRPSGPEIPEGEVVPTSQWSFANCPLGPPGTPSTTDICLAGGFRNDRVYQLKYKAINPPVMGLGYVTTRDFVSFLRNATTDDNRNPNPLPGIATVIGQGNSASGFYLRDYLYQGFNEDEQGRRVFDGVIVQIAGADKPFFNYRFAQPAPSDSQHAGRYVPDTNFPRTYAIRQDPLHPEKMDGILKRPSSDPKVIHYVTSHEYRQLRASLVDTDEEGTVDLVQPDNVREYLFSSMQHGPGAPAGYGVGNRQCQQLTNPTHYGSLARALLVALDDWIRNGIEPPNSRVPRIGDGTLIPPDEYCDQFPSIPGVNCNGLYNGSGERNFGPRVSGNRGVIDKLIPEVLSVHRVLLPKVDEIGNDIAGIRHPFVEAPIATLTGWNLRTPEFTEGDLCDLNGMMIPLFKTRAERLEAGDPRPSLEELYHNHKGYVKAVRKAAKRLAHEGFLLDEDVDRIIQEADDSDVLK